MRTIAIAAALCGFFALGGCGIKGPLYLPQTSRTPARPALEPSDLPPQPAPAPAADHNKPASQDSAQ